MQQLHFSIDIRAPKEKVWHTMLDDKTYREWTSEFSEGSYYEGDWEEGSKILFLAMQENGKTAGMVSEIAESRPYEFVSIRHLGVVNDGVEDTTSEATKGWAGALENYTLEEKDGVTQVKVDIDLDEKELESFQGMWPRALQKLKSLAERQ